MAFRGFLLTFLVVSMAAIPTGEAQLGRLVGGNGGVGGLFGGLLGSIQVEGKLFCTLNGGAINGTSTDVFPNALVQLQCGNGNVVASTRTNQAGLFGFVLNPLQFASNFLLSNCNLVVVTPLSTCNIGLPGTGGLISPLQLLGNTIVGLFSILKVAAVGFRFDSNILNN